MRYIIFVFASVSFCFAGTLSTDLQIIKQVEVETVYISNNTRCPYGKEEILDFAEHLYELGEFDRAAIEYLRFNFFFSEDDCAAHTLFRAAICKEKARNFNEARLLYESFGIQFPERENYSKYRIGLTYLLTEDFDSILAINDTSSSAMKYLYGWALFGKRKYAKATNVFKSIINEDLNYSFKGSISFLKQRSKYGENMYRKSPFLAAVLSSFVPGLGRGYCGRWGDCFFSFSIFSVSGGLTWHYWDKDHTFSVIMAFVSIFFYLGNIYGSFVGADIINVEQENELYNRTLSEVPHSPEIIYNEYPCSGN